MDPGLKEWWVDNPFDLVNQGHNLSAYERKRVYLNVKGPDGQRNFLDVSGVSGADNDGDGRCVVAGDFRHTGQLDVVLRQGGGGPVHLYENHFPRRHYLEVSPRGTMKEYEPGRRSNPSASAPGWSRSSTGSGWSANYTLSIVSIPRCRTSSISGWATRPASRSSPSSGPPV